jgi:hypothetical protein
VKPLVSQVAPPWQLAVFYERDPGHMRAGYRVVVTHESDPEKAATAFVAADYEPVFGIDASDMAAIHEKAEEMCRGLER